MVRMLCPPFRTRQGQSQQLGVTSIQVTIIVIPMLSASVICQRSRNLKHNRVKINICFNESSFHKTRHFAAVGSLSSLGLEMESNIRIRMFMKRTWDGRDCYLRWMRPNTKNSCRIDPMPMSSLARCVRRIGTMSRFCSPIFQALLVILIVMVRVCCSLDGANDRTDDAKKRSLNCQLSFCSRTESVRRY